jgi:2-polyprenyl-3-methyl-5-hydroxy-6-metoxy-1,4-benzoquinol methylase
MNYKRLNECLCCGSDNLETILDLNDQPLANSYKTNIDDEGKYPLKLNLCNDCFHTQLSVAVDPDLLFRNYLYVTGTSNTLNEYSKSFAKQLCEYYEKLNGANARNVLDIACNDGTQLNYFKDLNLKTFGIDPARNLYELSVKNHNIICDYYKKNLFNEKFDLILAQNVFAHNSDPYSFLVDCKEDLSDTGLVFIQTSQSNMILNNEFDTIYHEHISFFNSNSMNELSKRVGLHLIDIFKTDIHGTSYVFVFSKNPIVSKNLTDRIELEKEQGLYSYKTYLKYANNAKTIVSDLKMVIEEFKSKGYRIVGYGAAAKGNTLLNFGNIHLDFIIDDNKLKQGLYTPGTNIPIKDISELNTISMDDKVVFVPLAWNFYKEISSKIKNARNSNKDYFIRYFPKVEVMGNN